MKRASESQPILEDLIVSVIVVNFRTPKLTERCLASLKREKSVLPSLQVVVVDGGSGDGSAEELTHIISEAQYCGWVSLKLMPVNGGFGWANNQGIAELLQGGNPPEFIHLLNPDCEIEAGAISCLAKYLNEHQSTGAVGSQLLQLDGSITASAFKFPSVSGEFARGARTAIIDRLFKGRQILTADCGSEVDWVTGASVMFRSDALKKSGLFDEGFFLYHEETELMWRLRRTGWRIAFAPQSRVWHVGGASTGLHSREVSGRVRARRPYYWYRSRARLFTRIHGRSVAGAAYVAWMVGHTFWALRRWTGLAPKAKPISHQFRDHVRYGFPRGNDRFPAFPAWNDPPSTVPAWKTGSSV